MASKGNTTAAAGMDKYAKITKLPIDERCDGCEKVQEIEAGKFCSKYANPSFHWENDQICSFATHIKREVKIVKKVVNPLKASKRAAAKKK
jgi:hypothetical protein